MFLSVRASSRASPLPHSTEFSQGVSGANLTARGAGPDNPIASNGDVNGRAQNRRVEVNLKPIPGQEYQQQGQVQQYP